jgi:tRNA(fMet)-specific endonuclease VapC
VIYLLDRSAVIALLAGHAGFRTRLLRHQPTEFATPQIVVHQWYCAGCKGCRTAENLARLDGLSFDVPDVTRDDARLAGEASARLAAEGRPIGPCDVLIAGQSVRRGLTLVTRSMQKFYRILGLKLKNWETQDQV